MKIVNSKEFYELPSGTLYCNYTPCHFMELNIKGDTLFHDGDIPRDYYYQSLIGDVESDGAADLFDILNDAESNGTEFKLESDCSMRDGLFDDTRLYAIYNKDDVKQLIKQLINIM